MDGENYQHTCNIKKRSFTAYNIMPNLYVVTQIHVDRISIGNTLQGNNYSPSIIIASISIKDNNQKASTVYHT